MQQPTPVLYLLQQMTATAVHQVLLVVWLAGLFPPVAGAQTTAESPHDLMKDVIYNELRDRQRESYWEYRLEKQVGQESTTERQVETPFGPVHRVLARNGRPLSPPQVRQEDERLQNLERNPGEQLKVKQEHEADEARLERLMQSMPDAFLYTLEVVDQGGTRLAFKPNPAYVPATYETRAFHAMAGEVWIDAEQKRLIRLQGTTIDRVDFGFGLFGRIDKGGTFQIQRQAVSATHWKTNLVEVHLSGRLILFKSLSRNQREVRSYFEPVPPVTALAEAVALLERPLAEQTAASISPRRQKGMSSSVISVPPKSSAGAEAR